VDLGGKKDTMEILAQLNRAYPFASNDLERGVQTLLGPINKQVVHRAVKELQEANAESLGALMVEAQEAFDCYAAPACPGELASPLLHQVLNFEALKPHIWGGKGVGSQGDGSAQFIARSVEDQQTVIEIIERDLKMSCLPLTIRAGQKVRKAVIPAAGFGTRLFPASKATKKEMFPIIDQDGIAKPLILLLVEEALSAGIEEVIIIVQQDDLEEFRSFFNTQITIENYNKLSRSFQEYANRILEIGRCVKFAIQNTQDGFGHAVYCAREAVGDEPFLLMLGDHLYRSNTSETCAQQLIAAYNQHGTSILGLRRTAEEYLANFGVATGVWLQQDRLLNISEFSEKPTADYARNNLCVPDLPEGEYLTVFGQYIIKPMLFDYIEENIKNNVRERGEYQLTSALDRLRREDGFLGLAIDGQRFDIGLPEYYLETLRTFSTSSPI
jgi:UTP-glucose-1-phosphate uridylyltransferase